MIAEPQLQLALDFANLSQALRAAHEAWDGGVRRLEAGTPLIKSEGLDCVRKLRAEFPDATIAAEPITTYAPSHAGALAYRRLAREVIARGHSA